MLWKKSQSKNFRYIIIIFYFIASKFNNKLKVKENLKEEQLYVDKNEEPLDNINNRNDTKNFLNHHLNNIEFNNTEVNLMNSKYFNSSENTFESKGFVGNKFQKSKQDEIKKKLKNIELETRKKADNSIVVTNFK